METSQSFAYDLPSAATLVGIYVEASDDFSQPIEMVAPMGPGSAKQVLPRPEDLFGFTLTVQDSIPTKQSK
jgi:hypothetical protein